MPTQPPTADLDQALAIAPDLRAAWDVLADLAEDAGDPTLALARAISLLGHAADPAPYLRALTLEQRTAVLVHLREPLTASTTAREQAKAEAARAGARGLQAALRAVAIGAGPAGKLVGLEALGAAVGALAAGLADGVSADDRAALRDAGVALARELGGHR